MKETEEREKEGLDVKFYPIRNRYLERSVHGHSRLLKVILFLCAIIAFVVVADFSGYAFEDIKTVFSSAVITQLAENEDHKVLNSDQSRDVTSMYAGHSIAADSLGQLHSRESLHGMLVQVAPDSQTTLPGYFGIDVSHWQNAIDWSQVARDTIPKKIDFSIVKATQGAGQTDPNFTENWRYSNENFKLAGAYHYYIYEDDPKAQANNFISTVSLQQGNFPPIVDIELNCSKCDTLAISSSQMINDLQEYLEKIENHFKVKPIIYTNRDFFEKYLSGDFNDYNFWMANYQRTPPQGMIGFHSDQTDTTSLPRVVIWQFTDYERLKGIVGKVDMNFLPEQARNSIEFVTQE